MNAVEAWKKAEEEVELYDGEKHYIRYGENNDMMFIIQAVVEDGKQSY